MRLLISSLIVFAAGTLPLAAQERLERNDTEGADRICYYRSLLPGLESSRERAVRVGLGEPCPRVTGTGESPGPAPRAKVPTLASLVGPAERAGRPVCVYRFGTETYAVPATAGQMCPATPIGY